MFIGDSGATIMMYYLRGLMESFISQVIPGREVAHRWLLCLSLCLPFCLLLCLSLCLFMSAVVSVVMSAVVSVALALLSGGRCQCSQDTEAETRIFTVYEY